jgi:hypothetical protein
MFAQFSPDGLYMFDYRKGNWVDAPKKAGFVSTLILCLLVGWLGFHRAHIGRSGLALLQFLLFVVALALAMWVTSLPLFVLLVAPWWITDIVLLAARHMRDKYRRQV